MNSEQPGVDEGLDLLGHLLDGADEVVADVLVVRRPRPTAGRRRVSPATRPARASRVDDQAVRPVGAHDRVGSRPTSSQYRASSRDLCTNDVEAHLPVGHVGVAGRDAQRHLLAPTADQDRRAGRTQRLRVAEGAVEVDVVAVEVDRLLRPQAGDDLQRLVEQLPGGRLADGYVVAVGLVLPLVPTRRRGPRISRPPDITSMPAASLASSPTLRYADAGDQLAELHPVGALGQRGQHRERLEAVGALPAGHRLDVVVDPEVVVAQRLGPLRPRHRCRPGRRRRPRRCTRASSPGGRTRRARTGCVTRTPSTGPRPSSGSRCRT